MSFDRQKVIDVLLGEVGYLEKASNAQLDSKTGNAGYGNYTKYARDLDALGYFYNGPKQGYAYCDVTVDWAFVQAYGVDAALYLLCQPKKSAGAGCTFSAQYYKAKGQFHKKNPQPADQIFFGNSAECTHTGVVYDVDEVKVYTVEGNTSSKSGVIANGGGVFKKKHKLTLGRIAGYGRPAWGDTVKQESEKVVESTDIPESTYTTYTVKKGDTLWKIAQTLLGNGNKYKLIQGINGLSGDLIRIGQKLKIPKG